MPKRTNEEWIEMLRGPKRDEALAELRVILLRGLRMALNHQQRLGDADLEDFVQEALLKIVSRLDSFRGEAQFTTWAYTIAVRVALTELRRRRWRDVSLESLSDNGSDDGNWMPEVLADSAASPEEQTVQRMVIDTMRRVIENELTDKQRQALVAARVQGMPLDELARRMGTNRNALYKLLYDARVRLQKGLAAQGLHAEDIMAAFGLNTQPQPAAVESATAENSG